MQRGQTQVARLCVGDGGRHGFAIADLADQDHVGRLAQRVLQADLQRSGVGTDFTLVDDRLLVAVDVFDRVLDGEDVAGVQLVAQVDHGRQRGGLASARGTDHQHQTPLLHHQIRQHGRHVQ
ncbi:hypothetical protein D9M69_654780 [compost metagenome]